MLTGRRGATTGFMDALTSRWSAPQGEEHSYKQELKLVAGQRGADTSRGAFMSRWGALPARCALFSNRESIFLSLLFDATCFMTVSCLFWHLLSVRMLICPCRRLHDPGAPGIGRQVVGWQTKRWGGRFFRWGGTCHLISIQSYAPATTVKSCGLSPAIDKSPAPVLFFCQHMCAAGCVSGTLQVGDDCSYAGHVRTLQLHYSWSVLC